MKQLDLPFSFLTLLGSMLALEKWMQKNIRADAQLIQLTSIYDSKRQVIVRRVSGQYVVDFLNLNFKQPISSTFVCATLLEAARTAYDDQ